jgi:adenosylcobinamide amidohydrolase
MISVADTDRWHLTRDGRVLRVRLSCPHRVLSTCRVNGGLREDLTDLVNHQCSEGVGPPPPAPSDPAGYHGHFCAGAGLPAATTALMSTAANMQCASLSRVEFDDLQVAVAATAGVLGNATRAGDPAFWHEEPDGCRRIAEPATTAAAPEAGQGTIVTLVLINRPCTPACLVQAAAMVTEAKSTAVLDLRMPSLQSPRLATGTGTDQLAIAAPLPLPGDWERHWAGSHTTLGQLLAQATRASVTRCLLLQNGVCAELRRSVCAALGRHGCDEAALRDQARARLDAAGAGQFEQNLLAIIHDPMTASAAYALAEVLDLIDVGVLHVEAIREAILNQAALLAAAVAVAPERFASLRERLRREQELNPARLAALAVVEGFACKWT